MKTLDEHNEETNRMHSEFWKTVHNTGVACDDCGDELVEDRPGNVNLSNPPSIWVMCMKCDKRSLMYL